MDLKYNLAEPNEKQKLRRDYGQVLYSSLDVIHKSLPLLPRKLVVSHNALGAGKTRITPIKIANV